MGYFLTFWIIVFPFIYGQVFSRLFGLRRKIDHWILFTLHISVSVLAFIVATVIYFAMSDGGTFTSAYVIAPVCFAIHVIPQGFVWQFVLTERKLNGFVCSLIANAVYAAPIVIILAVAISQMS